MKFTKPFLFFLISLFAISAMVPSTGAPKHRVKHVVVSKGGALGVVRQFEAAYMRKDKQTMIMRLMAPTTDADTIEKRYQWFRGYGPRDMPGSKHPPILFESSHGSFVPAAYTIVSSSCSATKATVVVKEHGIYRDEDGGYRVERNRTFKLVQARGRWWVLDYVFLENPETYGFYVDDISDKMTHFGK